MTDQWGPWIDHDGAGCPVAIGTLGEMTGESHALSVYGSNVTTVYGDLSTAGQAWDWSQFGRPSLAGNGAVGKVLRYRVQRPRGLQILDAIIADLPVEVDA